MALPTSESQNKLLYKLMTQWSDQVQSPKFSSINAWIRIHISETLEGLYLVDLKIMIIELINLEQKCYPNYYWDDTMCWWRKKSVIGSDEDMSLTPLTFENWKSGQPDNTANMENRVVMTGKYDYA